MRSKRGRVGWVLPSILFYFALVLSLAYYYCPQVNCAALGNVAVPFGGYKQSGVGKEFGKHALDTCVLFSFFDVCWYAHGVALHVET